MRSRIIIISLSLVLLPVVLKSQPATDDNVNGCIMSAGVNATYLKDYRIKLPKATTGSAIPVLKANMYLMKNMKYRFSLCDSPGSNGDLYITIYDQGKELISSFNKSTGKNYISVDFVCNKTGLYSLWFGFVGGEQGAGVGVVSVIK